jgi:hypothetical protein
MGMSDKEFYTLLALVSFVLIYGGVVFWISDNYGRTPAVLSLNLLHILFLIYAAVKLRRRKKDD